MPMRSVPVFTQTSSQGCRPPDHGNLAQYPIFTHSGFHSVSPAIGNTGSSSGRSMNHPKVLAARAAELSGLQNLPLATSLPADLSKLWKMTSPGTPGRKRSELSMHQRREVRTAGATTFQDAGPAMLFSAFPTWALAFRYGAYGVGRARRAGTVQISLGILRHGFQAVGALPEVLAWLARARNLPNHGERTDRAFSPNRLLLSVRICERPSSQPRRKQPPPCRRARAWRDCLHHLHLRTNFHDRRREEDRHTGFNRSTGSLWRVRLPLHEFSLRQTHVSDCGTRPECSPCSHTEVALTRQS